MNAFPLDPDCPCGSGQRLAACCGSPTGGDYTEEDHVEICNRLMRFSAKGENASAVRRASRDLLSDLPMNRRERLAKTHELELRLGLAMFMHFDCLIRGSSTVAELYLRKERAGLSPRLRGYLAQMAAHPTSLYEVIEVFPGRGMALHDRVRNVKIKVRERLASSQIRPGWFLLSRITLQPDGTPVMDGATLPFDDRMRPHVQAWLAEQGMKGRTPEPRALIGPMFRLWQRCTVEGLEAPMPRLANEHGDEMVWCESFFAVADGEALDRALAAAGDWDYDEDEGDWTWFEPVDDEMRRSLGRLFSKEGEFVLETNSRERAARGREVLGAIAGVQWLRSAEKSMQQVMEKARLESERGGRTRMSPTIDLPMEEQQALLDRLMDKHYRDWVDHPLPMFGGRTPRAMAKIDPEAVSRAIWDIENPDGTGPKYDAGWMYGELGVRRLGGGEFEAGVSET